MKRLLIKLAVGTLLSLPVAYGALYYAHAHTPHNCPKAKKPHDHHCDKHTNAGTNYQDSNPGDEVSFPGDCTCPVSCFFSGQGLPVD